MKAWRSRITQIYEKLSPAELFPADLADLRKMSPADLADLRREFPLVTEHLLRGTVGKRRHAKSDHADLG